MKLVKWHLRDKFSPLHQNQFAYQPAKSTETAVQYVVTQIQNAAEHKK